MSAIRVALGRLVVPVLALVTAFLLGGVVIVLTDFDHLQTIGTDPVGAVGGAIGTVIRGYGAMVSGAIGDPGRILTALQSGSERDIARAIRPITEGLLSATPLIFLGLGVSVAFRAGLFNLGSDGQFLIGGLGAVIGANALAGVLPPFVNLLAALGGGDAVRGGLRVRARAPQGAHRCARGHHDPDAQHHRRAGRDLRHPFGRLLEEPATRSRACRSCSTCRRSVSTGASWPRCVTAAVVSFLVFRTSLGFELRATGFSRTVARTAGMRPGRTTILAMSLSGGLAGLGGAFLALGPAGGLSGSGAGLVPLALALIAGLRPSGIVVAAVLYGALSNGAKTTVIATGVPLDILVLVIALAMMFVAAPGIVRSIWRLPAVDSSPEPAAVPTP